MWVHWNEVHLMNTSTNGIDKYFVVYIKYYVWLQKLATFNATFCSSSSEENTHSYSFIEFSCAAGGLWAMFDWASTLHIPHSHRYYSFHFKLRHLSTSCLHQLQTLACYFASDCLLFKTIGLGLVIHRCQVWVEQKEAGRRSVTQLSASYESYFTIVPNLSSN